MGAAAQQQPPPHNGEHQQQVRGRGSKNRPKAPAQALPEGSQAASHAMEAWVRHARNEGFSPFRAHQQGMVAEPGAAQEPASQPAGQPARKTFGRARATHTLTGSGWTRGSDAATPRSKR